MLGIKTILVPTDFSPESRRALRYANTLAKETGATLKLIYVVERPTVFPEGPEIAALFSDGERAKAAIARLGALVRDEVDDLVPAQVEAHIGTPYWEIVWAAKTHRADLIIISTHGYTGLKHVFLGSTAERVVRHAPCPVLVVRGKSGPTRVPQ
jgi:universal stress protein A